MSTMPELVQSALSALRHLQPANRAAAIAILSMWAHAAEIDVERVVNYYFNGSQTGTRGVHTMDTLGEEPRFRPGVGRTYEDGYADGYVDCASVKSRLAANPPRSLDEARAGLAETAMAALVAAGMISKESADALFALWSRANSLTPAEKDAIRTLAGGPQTPARRLLDETAQRWREEDADWRRTVLSETA